MTNEPKEPNNDGKKLNSGFSRLGRTLGPLVLVALLMIIFTSGLGGLFKGAVEELSYSTFKAQISLGNVQAVTVQGDKITGTLNKPLVAGKGSGD